MTLSNDYRIFDVAGQSLLVYTGGKAVDVNAAYALNESSAWLLSRMEGQEFTEAQLVEWLLAEYEVERDQAVADVASLLGQLREHSIVLD